MTEETLFFAALERTPAERQAFLEASCVGDTVLRQRLEAMIAAHEGNDDFLQKPALQQLVGAPSMRTTASQIDTKRIDVRVSAILRFLEPAQRPGGLGRLLHFEVQEVLGQGGFGVVLKAFDERLQRIVAIKILAPDVAASEGGRRRFIREAQAAAAVRHDNVIDIYAVEEQPVPYLVMECIGGQSLEEKLRRTGPLPFAEITRIGLEIAAGLAAAHASGLIHRDIKPSNILLEEGSERIKISDFGLARAVDDTNLTQSGLIVGTPQYMSPEQAEGQPVDQRSDLFSFGSVLYALCTGLPPFQADSTPAVLRRVCERPPRPIREINPKIPDFLIAIIEKLQAKKPEDRFQSAEEVGEWLAKPELASRAQPSRKRSRIVMAISLLALALSAWLIAAKPWQANRDSEVMDADALAARASPADQLKAEDISPRLLALVGGGDARQIPNGLAAILGDDRFMHEPGRNRNSGIMDIAASPDGKYLAVASAMYSFTTNSFTSWQMRLWDLATGKSIRDFEDHPDAIRAIVFSPDSERVGSAGNDGVIRVFQVSSGKKLLDFKAHRTPMRSIDWSADGKLLASSGNDGAAIVWDATDGSKKIAFDKHAGEVLQVSFSPDSQRLVSADAAGMAYVWDARSGDEIARVRRQAVLRSAVFDHDGKRVLIAGEDGVVSVSDAATGKTQLELKGFSDGVLCVAASPDGKFFATAGMDSCVRGWDATSGEPIYVCPGHIILATRVAYCNKGRFLASGDNTGRVHLFEAATGKSLANQHVGPVQALAISADGARLVTGGADRSVRLWDLATGRLERTLSGHPDPLHSVAVSPDGKSIASASAKTIKLWHTGSGAELHSLGADDHEVEQIAFSPDGTILASVGREGTVKLWDARSGQLRKNFAANEPCTAFAFSPDGQRLALASRTTIQIRNVADGREVGLLHGHIDVIRELAFHPNGRMLASAGDEKDSTVRLWDLASGKETRQLNGHIKGVRSVSWRADGKLLATCGGLDGTVQLWDFQGESVRHSVLSLFPIGAKGLHGVAFTPEGRHLVTANLDGTLYVIRLAERGTVYRIPE